MERKYFKFLIFFFVILIITPLNSEEKVTYLNLDAVLNKTIIGMKIVKKLNDLKNVNLKQINTKKKNIKNKEQDLVKKKIFYLKRNLKPTF